MLGDQHPQLLGVLSRHRPGDDAVRVEAEPLADVGDASRHARADVGPDLAERDRDAAGHVLAEMVAGALNNGDRS